MPKHLVPLRSRVSRKLSSFTALLLIMVGGNFTTLGMAPAAAVTPPASCSTEGTPAVSFLSDDVFHINTAQGSDADYAGYSIVMNAASTDLWAQVGDFTGSVISLADKQPSTQSLGAVASGETKYAYFLVKASGETSTAQTHTLTVFDGDPNNGGTALCAVTSSYVEVADTITANANKVDTITVSTSGTGLGATGTVTVTGSTGTIGAGPANDPGVINFAPVVTSSFPANAWRFTSMTATMNPGTGSERTVGNILHLLNSAADQGPYTATYTFTAVGYIATQTAIDPVQYIASGTQVKRTGSSPETPGFLPSVVQPQAAPTVDPSTPTTAQGAPVEITPTVTGTNIDNSTACIVDPADSTCKTSVTIAGQGTYAVNTTTGKVTFTPDSGYNGTTTAVTYKIKDNLGQEGSGTITVTVTAAPPTGPTVNDVTASTPYNTAITRTPTVTGGTNPDVSTACLVDPTDSVCKTTVTVTEGTFTVNTTTGAVTFTPAVGKTGTAPTLTYKITDQNSLTGSGSVTFTVDKPAAPTITPMSDTTPFDTNVVKTPSTTGTQVDPSTACLIDPADSTCKTTVTIAGQGTWTVNSTTGAITFDPVRGFTGPATQLTYRISDAFGQNGTTTYDVTVGTPVAPTLTGPGSPAATPFNTAVDITLTTTPGTGTVTGYCFETNPGCVTTLTVAGEGTWTVDNSGKATFTPATDYTGTTTPVTVRVTDDLNMTATASISATVAPAAATSSITGIIWFDKNHDNVKDADEPVLPGVTVSVTQVVPAGVRGFYGVPVVQTVVTDQNGAYTFVVEPGSYTVSALLSLSKLVQTWDTSGLTDWLATVNAPAGGTSKVDFAASGAATLQGTVAFTDGTIVPGALVICTWEGLDGIPGTADDLDYTTTANEDGAFTLTSMPGGEVTCLGIDPITGKMAEPVTVTLDVAAVGPVLADLSLPVKDDELAWTGSSTGTLATGIVLMLIGLALLTVRRVRGRAARN